MLKKEIDNNIFTRIYYYLWQKDEMVLEGFYKVNVPDTIIFQDTTPLLWFFTSKNGVMLMKKLVEVAHSAIQERFIRRRKDQKLDVIAQYMYQEAETADSQVKVHYIKKDNFIEFLSDKNKPKNGILQEFIEPSGCYQQMTQAIWGPNLCLLSKRQNIKNLFQVEYDPYGILYSIKQKERCSTFDGPHIFSISSPCSGIQMNQQVRKMIENIVLRITSATFQNFMINRGIFYFKCDRNQQLWFLYCTSMRYKDVKNKDPDDKITYKPLQLDDFSYGHYKHIFSFNEQKAALIQLDQNCFTQFIHQQINYIIYIYNIYIIYRQNKIKYITKDYIISCSASCQSKDLRDISYLALHKHHLKKLINSGIDVEANKNLQKKSLKFIPQAIQKKEPKLSYPEYKILIQLTDFQKKIVKACLECFIQNSQEEVLDKNYDEPHGAYNYFSQGNESKKTVIAFIQNANRHIVEIKPPQKKNSDYLRKIFQLNNLQVPKEIKDRQSSVRINSECATIPECRLMFVPQTLSDKFRIERKKKCISEQESTESRQFKIQNTYRISTVSRISVTQSMSSFLKTKKNTVQ